MIDFKVETSSNMQAVVKKAKQGSFKSLGHAGAVIRLAVRRSIRRRKKASTPGTPPNTQTGQLRESIRYAVDGPSGTVVIGPSRADIDEIGRVHEFGGPFRGRSYPERPFMGPALQQNLQRIPREWRGIV